ncbi:MAG: RNA polymerase factor sigma-54 [Gemmatimonadota bacterium]|nr:MAG: RNA polymerase factor sigma-54 [Gemmatimonadota bacterium]
MKSPGLDLSQRLKLEQKLAPQLIQSLQLLQLSTLELEQLLKQELEINPFLEETTDLVEVKQTETTEEPRDEKEEEIAVDRDQIDWSEYVRDGFEMGYSSREGDGDQEMVETYPPREETLEEHLLSQLKLTSLSEDELRIGENIIGNLDDDGYLTCPIEDIASAVAVPVDDVEKVLKVIQTFDPVGVGARDLRECLIIQLNRKDVQNPLVGSIVDKHLLDLKRGRFALIAKTLGVSEEDVHKAAARIARLNPRPGWGPSMGARTIFPDVIIEKIENNYVVMLNDKNSPMLRVNPLYRSVLEGSSTSSPETKRYVVDKLNAARWLIKSIDQRRSTILAVVNYLAQAQRDFLEHGVTRLKPMVLQEVAEALEMSVSTVSRVTSNKYVQTPRGIFPLKYFFDAKIESRAGEEVSSKRVKERITRLVEEENQKKPLSDQEIANRLKEEGFNIARRTVSKYREQLRIMPARFRKR